MLCSATALASGISFDGKKVTEPHKLLHLTNEQIMELCDKGQLTLTDGQHARLLKKSPNFPKTIYTIISCFHNDCTCGVKDPYAILLPGGASVAIEDFQFKNLKDPPTSGDGRSMLYFLYDYRDELAKRGIVLPPFKWNYYGFYNFFPNDVRISNTQRYGSDTPDKAVLAAPADKKLSTIWISFEGASATTIENEIRAWLEKNLPEEYHAAMEMGGKGEHEYYPDGKGNPNVIAIQKSLDKAIRAIPSMKKTFRILAKKGYQIEKIGTSKFSIVKNPDGSTEFQGDIYINLKNKKSAPPSEKQAAKKKRVAF